MREGEIQKEDRDKAKEVDRKREKNILMKARERDKPMREGEREVTI